MSPAEQPPAKKRVLLVISSGGIGGGETHATLLARCLQADPCFDVSVVCHPGGQLEQIFQRLNLPVRGLELEDLRRFKDQLALAGIIRRERPDLIHAHLNRAALICSLAGRLFGCKVLATAHGLTRSHYYRFATHVIAVSDAVRAHLAGRCSGLGSRMTVIKNGIPPQATVNAERLRQLRAEFFVQPDQKIVTVVGKLHQNKGQAVAIRALQALPTTLPVRLFLVGDGPDEADLKALVKTLALGPKVTFVPSQPRMNELYQLSTFVVVPSFSEALSLVALEALRQGRPVIASDCGGLPEVVRNGETGLLVKPGDPGALAKALEDGLRDYRRHELMAQRGKAMVLKDFTIEQSYLATRKLYLQLLGLPMA